MDNKFKISLFKCLTGYESRAVGLEEIVRLIKYDQFVIDKTELYRSITHNVSREKAKMVKEQMMYAFSVGVQFDGSGRQPEHISHATGLAMCDIDHVCDEKMPEELQRAKMEELRAQICADPHTLLFYKTISGYGYRVLYRYLRISDDGEELHLNCEAYPAAWKKGNDYYYELTGYEYDSACSDYTRLSGMAHDADVYFNPDAEPFIISDDEMLQESMASGTSEPGRPRKTYGSGTQHASPVEAWPTVQRILSRKSLSYTPGRRHDYIVHAVYLFCRFGAEEDDLTQWASQEWGDLPKEERDNVITHCYKHCDEFGTWSLKGSHKGQRQKSLLSTTEIRQWLDERCRVICNVVTDQIMLQVNSRKGDKSSDYQIIDERILASIRCEMEEDTGKRVLDKDIKSVLYSHFSRLVHPVRDYIEGLPAWDGIDRVKELSDHVSTVPVGLKQTALEAQELFEWTLHKWLAAMVCTWMRDDVTNHTVFTLIGPQGIYKTTFFRFLLPPELRTYFWENGHNSFSSRDDHIALTENCLVDIEEVEASSERDMGEMKQLITSDTIKERRPYAPFRTAKHRLASFCATGNLEQFLTDDTGNRRWLCHQVSQIDDPREWNIDYAQLYAQLRDELKQGFSYWFNKSEERRVEEQAMNFTIISDEEQLVRTRLRKPHKGETPKLMNATSILLYLNCGHISGPLKTRKVAAALKKAKFKMHHRVDGNFYEVIEVPYQDIQANLMAVQDSEEGYETGYAVEQELPF